MRRSSSSDCDGLRSIWNMMEGHRGRRNKTAPAVLLLLCLLTTVLTSQQSCPHGDFLSEKGICCNKCAPGFKLGDECQAPGQRSNCIPCPDKQYTDEINYAPNCKSCTRCKASKNEEEVTECEKHRNTICRCKKGYYKSMIDSDTYECLKCKECAADEKKTSSCTSEKNTQCECKENYYRVKNTKKCEPCKNCNPQCIQFCSTPTTTGRTRGPNPLTSFLVNIIAGVAVSALVLLFLVVLITYVATKRFTKKKLRTRPSEPSGGGQDLSKQVLIVDEEPWSDLAAKAVPQSPLSEQETSNLPDCVPQEINIPDLIYAVLDLVPVQQVKQLARTLGVKDTEIEQAEMDHRSCREAHYQMLRVWAERGSQACRGGRGRMLYHPLLKELLEQLRMIHLGRAAEELEAKYGGL